MNDKPKIEVLTTDQQRLLRERATQREEWHDEGDIARRKSVAREMQKLFKSAGVADGRTISRPDLALMIAIQWKVHNLNPQQATII